MKDDYYCIVGDQPGSQLFHVYGEGGELVGECDEIKEKLAENEKLAKQRDYYYDAWCEAVKSRDYWREEAKRAIEDNEFRSGER